MVYEKQGQEPRPVLAIELDGKEHFEDEVVLSRDRRSLWSMSSAKTWEMGTSFCMVKRFWDSQMFSRAWFRFSRKASSVAVLKIGVITPFVNQRKLIEEALEREGLSHVSCGTVHAFQGSPPGPWNSPSCG